MNFGIRLVLCLGLTFFSILGESASAGEPSPNVLLICVDDLRPELKCYGRDYVHSPNIDRLASMGTRFDRHYVQGPTCGVSRYSLLTGLYGGQGNGAMFQRAKKLIADSDSIPPSMPQWFRDRGYRTVSVGKVSHHPGGLGGKNWDDEAIVELPGAWDKSLLASGPWQHPRGWMHGLANGEIRVNPKKMDVFQSVAGGDSIYPDGGSIEQALAQIDALASDTSKPFFLAVGILRPHLPFGAPATYMRHYETATLPPTPHPEKPTSRTTWHRSGEFMRYNHWGRDPNADPDFAIDIRKHYAACVSYADAQVGKLLRAVKDSGSASNTIIVLWGDHGWHLGEHAVWGKHTLFEESLHAPLIIFRPDAIAKCDSVSSVDTIVETVDIFPTLCDLTGLRVPDFVAGVSLRKQLDGEEVGKRSAVAAFKGAQTLRTESHRLIVHRDGYVELYDHTTAGKETENVAEANPEIVERLKLQLSQRLR